MKERFNLLGISVSELPAERIERSTAEVHGLLQSFSEIVATVGVQYDIELDLLIVESLEPHVDRIMTDHGRLEMVGPYRSGRQTVAAQAITLRDPRHSHVRATIVMNRLFWLADIGDSVLTRVHLLTHELGHVLQQARGISDWRRARQPITTHAENIRRAALILWEEYDADRFSYCFCRAVCRTADAGPLSFVNAFGRGMLNSGTELLDRLCVFVGNDVQGYRRTGKGLETLYPKGISILGELLLVLSHAAAAYSVEESLEDLTTALSAQRGFSAYLSEDWDAFLSALGDCDRATEAEGGLSLLIDRVISRTGLEIQDLPDGGMYIHVTAPTICTES